MSSKSLTTGGGIDCETCQAYVADYVRVELSGQSPEETYPDVAFHIETCEVCEAAFYREFRSQAQRMSISELRQIGERSGVAQAMEQILARPAPQPAPAPDRSWHEVALDYGRAWLEGETGRWRQVWLSLASLGQGAAGAPVLAGLMGAEAEEPGQGTLNVAPADADFEIKLAVSAEPAAAGPKRCRVDVALTLADRFGDFSGAQLTLLWGDEARFEETDALGRVSFGGLPCDQVRSMGLTVVLPE